MYTKIIGTGSYLPEHVRTNAELENMVDTSDEWIVTRTGIRERRIAAPNETVATMGLEAAKNALDMAGVKPEQIGLIIVATTSGTHAFPSSACQIQSMLGIKGCPAFDVAAACAGFTYALSVADQYVKNGAVDYALVIGADVLARTCDPADRGTIIIFGDGAGAVVLGASEEPGIISTHLHDHRRDAIADARQTPALRTLRPAAREWTRYPHYSVGKNDKQNSAWRWGRERRSSAENPHQDEPAIARSRA